MALLRRERSGSRPQLAAAGALERLGAGERAPSGSALTSPLAFWIVGLVLFGSGVALASSAGILADALR